LRRRRGAPRLRVAPGVAQCPHQGPHREVELNSDGSQTETFKLYDTTVGRALLSDILPEGMSFELINRDLKKKAISELINACYRRVGLKATVIFADS